MQLLRFIPGKHYFITIFIIGSMLFGIFSTVLYRQYMNVQLTNQWAIHYYESLRLIKRILVNFLDMETGTRGYMLTGQPVFLKPYDEAMARLGDEIKQLKNIVSDDPSHKKQMEIFFDEAIKFQHLLESQVAIIRKKDLSLSIPQMLTMQKEAMDRLRHSITIFTDEGLTELKKELEISHKKEKDFLSLVIIGTILAIGAMFLATIVILSLMARSRKAEEQQHQGEERLRTVMNGVNDGLYDYNAIDKVIYYSPAYKSMLGYSDLEHPDTVEVFRRLLHPDDVEHTFNTYRRYKNREITVYTNIFRLRHKDGSWRWIMSRGVGIWDKAGNMTRLIGTHTDITEQKNSEEDLKQLNSDLETFAYIASHDLRSPLVNLKGFASEMEYALQQARPVLEKIEPDLEPQEQDILFRSFEKDIPEALQFIKQAVDKMDMLTNAVLDLSRIGKREFRFQPVETELLIERCLSSLAYEINKKDVEITYGALPTVITDSLALEQIFSNLIDNAVKYMVPEKKGKISISGQIAGKEVVFTIADNGRGIAEADRQKVFEIFRRARNTGDARGIGMGLAYVKATLRKLGGAIWFESAIDMGTTFHFRLPLAPPNSPINYKKDTVK